MRPETGLMWRRDLGREIPDRLVLMTREEALAETPIGPTPDVFVIEADLQGPMGGLRLMSELRSRQPTRNAAICILQAGHAPEVTALAFDMGANDLLPATISARELGLRLTRMIKGKRAADQVRASVRDGLRMALIDPLTGLHNRRYALGQLTAIAEDAQKRGAPFAVMVLDLDRFKQVNDLHGHPAGDSVLIEVARRLAANLRVTDLLARIGGEEFLIVLPDSDLALARQIAERLCKSIEERRFSLPDRIDLSLTASIGLAIRDSDRTGAQRFQPEDVNEVIDRADKALLVAKTAGRNRVNISQTAA